jgi:O-antigen/teichoic acid export membrane protein
MRIGQTSLVVFVSKLSGSVVGFLATLYIARELGPAPLGIYSVVLAVVAWVGIVGDVGITGAVQKRMSEGDSADEFLLAGGASIILLFVVVSVALYASRDLLVSYIGEPVTHFVVLLLFVTLLEGISGAALTGRHLVHIKGLFIPVRMTLRSVAQIALVFLGFELVGLLIGHALGYAVVGLLGLYVVRPSLSLPSRRHFEAIGSYARYAWMGGIEGRAFGWVDVAVMGLFVAPDLIGVYSVSWTIGTFLLASGIAISSATFPEISNASAADDPQAAAPILRDALRYAGLILIPGLVGATILGPRILRIYGSEFVVGTTVLVILVSALLIRSYQIQLQTTLNAVDRPDLTFRVNGAFIGSNLVLNLILVYTYGWVGAAVATLLATGLGMALAYRYVSRLIDFELPYTEVGKQIFAAGVTGLVAAGGLWIEESYVPLNHNFALVLILVTLGAGAYFAVLYSISPTFRTTVRANAPFEIPTIR